MSDPDAQARMKRFGSAHVQREAWRARWDALPSRVRMAVSGLLAALVVALLLAALFRNDLSRWLWPDSRSDELSQQAAHALQQGRLSASDGSGARELYQAALAVQPDQVAAREGLGRVGVAALARATREIQAGRYAQAHAALQLARELEAPRARMQPIEAALRARETSNAGIDALLARAQTAHAAGRLDAGDDAALPLYQRVLALQPRNQLAVEGREDALSQLMQPAQRALQQGDTATLASLVRRAERFDPGHVALPELRAGLSRLLDADRRRLQGLLAGKRYESAAGLCLGLRKSMSAAALPTACTEAAVIGLLARARVAASDFDFASSEHLIGLAHALAPGHPQLALAQRHLAQARLNASKLPQTPRRTRRVAAQVASLLADAAQAQARGDWLTPPGESAWDRLRAARALAPQDRAVAQALAGLEPAARQCHADGLRANDLRNALTCLDVWRQVDPGDPDLPQARRRLAERWIAIGEERLQAGAIDTAKRALEQARTLDANTAGLVELGARLAHAQAPQP